MKRYFFLIGFTLLCSLRQTMLAQTPSPSLLEVEIQNHRGYTLDVADVSQLAKSPSLPASTAAAGAFRSSILIGDIVSVNGTPVKGTVFERTLSLSSSPTFTPGTAIADVQRGGIYEWNLDFLNPDGTPIGRILVQGMAGGPPPPGAPSEIIRASYIVVGGTGAFLGVRGGYFQNDIDPSAPVLITSAAEDPAYRRINGGGSTHAHLYLIPGSQPTIVATPSGPAVRHTTDFTIVSASKPAAVGEILSIYATGLGPTRPSVDPGKPFPASPLVAVASPVSVTVNGKPAEVLAAVGFPGAVDGYQVNFRLPADTTQGTATVQVSAAWIAGPAVKISVGQ